jgi:hypothetical protein
VANMKATWLAVALLFCGAVTMAKEADPIADAAIGLKVAIEDDLRPGGDLWLKSIRSKGCKTRLTAKGHRWTINWRTAEQVGLADTFIFVKAKGVQLAIVGDASVPDQAAKLAALNAAMQTAKARCAGA